MTIPMGLFATAVVFALASLHYDRRAYRALRPEERAELEAAVTGCINIAAALALIAAWWGVITS